MDMLHKRQFCEGSQTDSQDLIASGDKKKKDSLLHSLQADQMHLPKDSGARRLNISRPLSFSKRSLNISRQSFASEIPESDIIKLPNVTTFIHSLAHLSIASLVFATLALYILNAFLNIQDSMKTTTAGNTGNKSDVHNTGEDSGSAKLCRTGVALTCVVVAACFSCCLISAMQNVFASKIMKMNEGEERVIKYLDECSSSRVLAISAFFMCVPISFIDLAIYLSLHSPNESNMVGVVLLALGAVLCLVGGAHSCYHWREENLRALNGMPVYDSRFSVPANLASYATQCHNIV